MKINYLCSFGNLITKGLILCTNQLIDIYSKNIENPSY